MSASSSTAVPTIAPLPIVSLKVLFHAFCLSLPGYGQRLAEKAAGPEKEKDGGERKDRHQTELANVLKGEALHYSHHEGRHQRAGHAARTADEHHEHGADEGVHAHVVRGGEDGDDEGAGNAAETAPDRHGDPEYSLRINALELGNLIIFRGREHGSADLRLHEVVEDDHDDNGPSYDEKLPVVQRYPVNVEGARDDRVDQPLIRGEGEKRSLADHGGEGDRDEHRVEEAVGQGPLDDDEMKEDAEKEHRGKGREDAQGVGKSEARHYAEGAIGPQHVELPLREVEYLNDAQNQGEP